MGRFAPMARMKTSLVWIKTLDESIGQYVYIASTFTLTNRSRGPLQASLHMDCRTWISEIAQSHDSREGHFNRPSGYGSMALICQRQNPQHVSFRMAVRMSEKCMDKWLESTKLDKWHTTAWLSGCGAMMLINGTRPLAKCLHSLETFAWARLGHC
jgi:hypothetical protein